MTHQFYDSTGIPIEKGDLLRTPHFRGARRKQHYLYHVAVMVDGVLMMVPTDFLEPTSPKEYGSCEINEDHAKNCTVIDGGSGSVPYYSRKKRDVPLQIQSTI